MNAKGLEYARAVDQSRGILNHFENSNFLNRYILKCEYALIALALANQALYNLLKTLNFKDSSKYLFYLITQVLQQCLTTQYVA